MIHQPNNAEQLLLNGDIWIRDFALWRTGTAVCAECGDLLLGDIEKAIGLCHECHELEAAEECVQ